ncbi:histidine phosphatase family protein [Nocardia sp. CDC160]|uniref:histidine phosphatase family protein n=1 Tax=Nocardia sp. CDC160 TaxID=3112166 RepID=UPI002DBC11FD|nr:histidine phosphatase family protein [Nocardia sp. CDC160]MEC3915246.1 histidine phosphatase family protein [Nocardia sp. CDC160]
MEIVGSGLASLTIVRHGESVANRARVVAERSNVEMFRAAPRDADSPLSELGRGQAAALGKRLAAEGYPFDLVLSSPYVRARETARIALEFLDCPTPRLDERLRDRETGILFGLTETGIRRRHPAEYAEQQRLGGFYYRPPGGESWPDVALRLRSVLREMGGHVLVFAHDIVIVLTRYLFGDLDEAELSAQTAAQVRNASITRWERDDSGLRLSVYNDAAHLD